MTFLCRIFGHRCKRGGTHANEKAPAKCSGGGYHPFTCVRCGT